MSQILSNVRLAFAGIRKDAGETLLAVANALAEEHRRRIGIQNPPPDYRQSSKPGEYPRRRRGHLQAGIIVDPDTPSAAVDQGYVDVGYAADVPYGNLLVDRWGRLGLEQTLHTMRAQLEQIAGGTRLAVGVGGAGS